jgi:hypothetical protein
MAITPNTYNMRTLPSAGKDFFVSLQTEAASGCEAILAAASGYSHYITKLLIRADAAMDVSVGSGGDGGTAVTTVHFGPIPLAAAGGFFEWNAPRGMGIKCTADLSIAIDSVGDGTMWIEAHGKSCQDI